MKIKQGAILESGRATLGWAGVKARSCFVSEQRL